MNESIIQIIKRSLWLSLIYGAAFWMLDTMLDWLFFYDSSFIDLFIADIPSIEIYIRLVFVVSIFIFGIINSSNHIRIKSINQKLRKSNSELESINQQLTASEQQLIATNQQLLASEIELSKKAHDLGGRMKELKGLYLLSQSIWQHNDIDSILQDATQIIPSSWQFPEITCCRIEFNQKEYLSKNFKESPWVQSAPIYTSENISGKIEVFYSKEMPALDEGPFLREERELIDTMANNLSKAIEFIKHQNQLEYEKSQLKLHEKQFKALFNGINDIMYVADPETYNIVHANDVAKKTYGDDIVGKKCYKVIQGLDAPCSFCTNEKILGNNFGKTFVWEFENKTNNKWYRCADKGIQWSDGRKLRFELATDITNQVHLNEELLASNQQLAASEQQLKSINEELKSEVKENEELKIRMQLANNSAGIGVWDYDLVNNILEWDDWMYKLYGVQPKEFEGAYGAWQKGLHPDDLERASKEVDLAINGTKEFDTEFRIIKPNGDIRYLKANATVLKNEKGEPIKMTGVNYDITEQKETQNNLLIQKQKAEENETRFKALHNASFGGITIHDKGLILDCNHGLSEITGYSIDELIGMDGLLLIAEEKREMVMSNILAQYEKPYEAIGIRKNGEKYPLRLEGRMIPYKGKEVRVVEFRDITEQKSAENQIIEKEQNLRNLLNNLDAGVVVHDSQTKIINYNPRALELLGLNEDEIKGKEAIDPYWKFIDENEKDLSIENYPVNIVLNTKTDLKRMLMGVVRPQTNDTIWLLVNGFPIFDGHKVLTGAVISFFDITTLKEAEKNLIEARQKAEESDQLKSAFLANMSHEIRTPMNGILGFTSLLEEPDLTGEEQTNYIEIIKRSGMRMLSTVNDIIDISKIDSGQMELNISDVDVCTELDSIYQFFKLEAKNKGLKLSYSKHNLQDQLLIKTDKNKFESIISNLVKNAIKYSDKGEIELIANIQNNQFICTVKDTGIGIPEDRIDNIFNRFEQVDISNSRANEGSGLGLAISKSYADMMNGQLEVSSTFGKGSKFTLKLPL